MTTIELDAAMATYTAARHAADAADDAWQAELETAFGRAAGDARYDARGKSTPQLLKLYEACHRAILEMQAALDPLIYEWRTSNQDVDPCL